jgi:hypothetical protein
MEDKKSPFKVPLRHFVRRTPESGDKVKKADAADDGYVWRHGLAPAVRCRFVSSPDPAEQVSSKMFFEELYFILKLQCT